ncbi:hypothetical protein F4679DRAFT_599449 [Xylaria curta]|nr:hypothetical protein F4679DRAFT_599449 [Xylaria curta]
MAPSYAEIASSTESQHESESHYQHHLQEIAMALEYRLPSYYTSSKLAREPLLSNSISSSSSSPTTSSRGPSWILEYISLVLSWITIIALVALMAKMDGIRLSSWTAPVSPNTVISILAAIARAPLGFTISSCIGQLKWNWFRKRADSLITFDRLDDASRGPWGSLWLIIWVKASHWVAIGAAIVIALLAFEPFLQAILSFDGRIDLVSNASEAKIGRSEILDAGFSANRQSIPVRIPPTNETVYLDTMDTVPDFRVVFAMNNAFADLLAASKQTPSFSCPTANCTWAPFTSLAVCSVCKDVSSHIKYRAWNESSDYDSWIMIEKSLPYPYRGISNTRSTNGTHSISIAASTLSDAHQTISFRNLSTMITSVGVVRASDAYRQGEMLWDKAPVTATECALYFCVKASGIVVRKGVLSETTVASWANRDFKSYQSTMYNSAPDTSTYKIREPFPEDFNTLRKLNLWDKYNNYSLHAGVAPDTYFEGDPSPIFVDTPRDDLVLSIPSKDVQLLRLPKNVTTRFNITQNTVLSTVTWINNFLPSYEFAGNNIYYGTTGQGPIAKCLNQSNNNLSHVFDQAATSLTHWIRDVSELTESGTVEEWVVHINVQWAYISLPLLAVLLGSAFCSKLILETRALRLEAWKTDTIATLTFSVDVETRAQLQQAHIAGNLAKTAKTMKVRLEDTGGRFELRAKQE